MQNTMYKYIILILVLNTIISCKNDEVVLPKPEAYLSFEYPNSVYKHTQTNVYEFETNKKSKVYINKKQWMRIVYPELKATIDITYRPVENNILSLLKEANKLTAKHAPKADEIFSDAFENHEDNVYGKLNTVTGNVASYLQFYVTDSTKNFLIGSLYFDTHPNYDSIYPAIKYIEKDIKHLMSSTRWRNFRKKK